MEGAPMIRKKKVHHDTDEEDEMEATDPSFTSTEGSSPDKLIASKPIKYKTLLKREALESGKIPIEKIHQHNIRRAQILAKSMRNNQ